MNKWGAEVEPRKEIKSKPKNVGAWGVGGIDSKCVEQHTLLL